MSDLRELAEELTAAAAGETTRLLADILLDAAEVVHASEKCAHCRLEMRTQQSMRERGCGWTEHEVRCGIEEHLHPAAKLTSFGRQTSHEYQDPKEQIEPITVTAP